MAMSSNKQDAISLFKLSSVAVAELQIKANCIQKNDSTMNWDWLNGLIFHNLNIFSLAPSEILKISNFWGHFFDNEDGSHKHVKKHFTVPFLICNRMEELSLNKEWNEFAQENHYYFKSIFGPESIPTLKMEFQVAYSFSANGEYEKALEVYDGLWDKYIKAFGSEHEEMLIVEFGLASTLLSLGRNSEALQLHMLLLPKMCKMFGENSANTLCVKNNMGLLLSFQGKYDEALEIFRNIAEWQEKKCFQSNFELGLEYPSIIITRHIIAIILYNQEKFVEANFAFGQLFEMAKNAKFYGAEHKLTLQIKHDLAFSFHSLGDNGKALEIMTEVYETRKRVLGENDNDTEFSKNAISYWETI